jgi:phage-related minor tail protein
MEKIPAELDKALEQGKVTLQDFMGFAKKLTAEYGENAKILAAGPEAAGDRLATSMSVLKDEVGKLLTPMGAAFQDWSKIAVDSITDVIKAFNKLFGIGDENKLNNLEKQLSFWKSVQTQTNKVNENLKKLPGKEIWGLEGTAGFEGTNAIVASLEAQIAALKKTIIETNNATNATTILGKEGNKVYAGLKSGAKAYAATIKSFSESISDAANSAFKKMEDTLVEFVKTGKLSFRSLAQSIVADMARIAIQQMIMKPFTGWFEKILPSADGNVFAQNGIQKFARGGIVDKPTIFPFKNGTGLMGEAGPEAIIPLKRGRDGKLGVAGGGGTNISVSVDASGSSVEGDEEQGRVLGEMLAAAIQAQLIEQRRPGGLLAT